MRPRTGPVKLGLCTAQTIVRPRKRRYGKTANWPTNGATAGTRSLTHVREL
jgi:hypothetical protein